MGIACASARVRSSPSRPPSAHSLVVRRLVRAHARQTVERRHNFRYEEAGAGTIQSHPRHDATSVRRQAELTRGKEREAAKKARKAEAKAQKEAELKRLKSLKKNEILERLRAIEQVIPTPLEPRPKPVAQA